MFDRVHRQSPRLQHLGDVIKGIVLTRPLQEKKEMGVHHSFFFFMFLGPYGCVTAACATSGRSCIAAEDIHTWSFCTSTMGTTRTHAKAKHGRQQYLTSRIEGVHGSERIARADQSPNIILGKFEGSFFVFFGWPHAWHTSTDPWPELARYRGESQILLAPSK